MIDPVTGAILAKTGGDILSGVTNYYGNKERMRKEREAINRQIQGEEKAYGIGAQYYDMLASEYGPEAATYLSDLASLREAQGKAPIQMGDFDDSKYQVDKYLSPYADYAQRQAAEQIQQSAAARGGMFAGSGATAKALQDRAMELGGQFYGEAANLANQDKNFGYDVFRNKFQADRQSELDRLSRLSDMTSQSGAARESLFGARSGKADLGMSKERSIADLAAGKSRAEGDFYKSTWDTVGGGIKSSMGGLGSYLGTKGGGPDALASKLGLDINSMSEDDKMGLLKVLLGGK